MLFYYMPLELPRSSWNPIGILFDRKRPFWTVDPPR